MKKNSNDIELNIETNLFKNPIKNYSQSTVPFIELYENGLLLVDSVKGKEKYCMVFSFSNANYILQKDNEKLKKLDLYKNIFNALSPDIHYQELYINVPVDEKKILNVIVPENAVMNTDYSKVYFENQTKFINNITASISDKNFYLALSYTKKSKLDIPDNIIMQAYEKIREKLQEIGATCSVVQPLQLLKFLHDFYNPFDDFGFQPPKNLAAKGMKIRDYIAPSVFDFKHKHIVMGDCYTRTFYVKAYSDELEDEFISHLMNNRFKIAVSKHIDHIDKDIALKSLHKQLQTLEAERQTRNQKNKREGTNYIPLNLQDEIDSCIDMQKAIKSSEELFDVGLYISVSAQTQEELEDITSIIKGVCREFLVTIQVAMMRQEDCLASIVPFANDKLNVKHYFLTSSVGITLPFSYINNLSNKGFFYGKSVLTGAPVIIDRKDDINGNGFYLGKSGSGKSIYAKMEINDILHLTNTDRVMVVDPEREFIGQCTVLGGQVIKISPDTKQYINPFDIDSALADGEDVIRTKTELIQSLMGVFKENSPLSAIENSIIDRSVHKVYQPFIKSNLNQSEIPTFKEFYKCLSEQSENEANDLKLYLERYVTGSVDIFSHHTNVSLDKRFVDFDLGGLGGNLKKAGMLVVLDLMWKTLLQNFAVGIYTWLYADEFHLFYNDNDDSNSSGTFFERVFARCRKYGGLATGITQNAAAIMQSPTATSMLQNSQFVVLLEQAKTNLDIISDLYGLSDAQKMRLFSPRIGEGIIISKNTAIPFEKKYPKDNIVYDTITTNFKDKIKV